MNISMSLVLDTTQFSQLLQFLDKVYNALSYDKFTLSIFIDLSMAFDPLAFGSSNSISFA